MPQSKVIQQGSTESMVFSMCAMNFVVAVTWTLYGYLVQDLYIQVPQLPVTVSPQAGTKLAGRSVGTRRVAPICSVSHYLSLQYSCASQIRVISQNNSAGYVHFVSLRPGIRTRSRPATTSPMSCPSDAVDGSNTVKLVSISRFTSEILL